MTTLRLLSIAAAFLAILDSVLASPNVVSLDFTKEVRRRDGAGKRLRHRADIVGVDITNEELLYLINVTIGTPPQPFVLQLDTGSSDIWVAASNSNACQSPLNPCSLAGAFDSSQSSTFQDVAQNQFQIRYVDESTIRGDYITDVINFGDAKVTDMMMGLATRADRALGIMGIGYAIGESITATTGKTYPNVIDQLKSQGFINTKAYSLWLNDLDSQTGSILFGGVDTAKYHGDLVALPVQIDADSGAKSSFTVVLTSVEVADGDGKSQYSQPNLDIPVILDSGTTLTYLPDDIANAIIGGVGALNTRDYGTVIKCSVGHEPATLAFGFGGAGGPTIIVDMTELVIPLYNEDGTRPRFPDGSDACQWGIQPAGNIPNLFGDTFLRSAYVVYDLENDVVAIGQTVFNATDSNVQAISSGGIPGVSSTASAAVATQTFTDIPLQTAGATGHVTNTRVTRMPSATFHLGGSNSAAGALRPPAVSFSALVTGAAIVTLGVLGGTAVVLM